MRPAQNASVKPYGWALSPWARFVRRATWWWQVGRHVRHFCSPLTLEGTDQFAAVRGPIIFIANHTSHIDTYVVLDTLPPRLRARTAVAAAADRFYRRKLQGIRFSLFLNAFPIERGGGRAALSYAEWLLERGWSLLIFPEGTRSRTGELQPFHHGVSLLALGHGAPVLPMYIEGARHVMPKGTRSPRPAAVTVRLGAPVTLAADTPLLEATARLEEAMRALAQPPLLFPEPAPAPIAAIERTPAARR